MRKEWSASASQLPDTNFSKSSDDWVGDEDEQMVLSFKL